MTNNKIQYVIRQYESQDYSQLIWLLNKVYDSNISQECLEKHYLTKDRFILVAGESSTSRFLGCAFAEIQRDYIRPHTIMYVTYVAVDEEYRELGIGHAIFNKIDELCLKYDCSALELTSADFRTEAHAFYKSIGFNRKKTTLFIKDFM